jgi:hypothetical protein
MDKENEFEDVVLSVEVEEEVIDKVITGEIMKIVLNITDDNYEQILENKDGNLALIVDELPNTFHGCYFYNNGEFPYAIKNTLEFMLLYNGENHIIVKIIGITTEPVTRFRFQGSGEPSIEDPEGDSCIWEIQFEVVPILAEPRHYLMRWNPTISSFKDKDFIDCVNNMDHGMFRMNWSIYDWQEARRGDFFYMMRTGDDKAGIVFSGQFITDPYPSDDWAGSNRRRMYVDMVCLNASEDSSPLITVEKLQESIPSIEWEKGHSGELLSDETTDIIAKLLEEV